MLPWFEKKIFIQVDRDEFNKLVEIGHHPTIPIVAMKSQIEMQSLQ